MAEIVTAVAVKVAEMLVVPIGKRICYPFKYKTYMKELEEQFQKLIHQGERVQHAVEEAKRNREKIDQSVEEWMQSVEVFTHKVENFIIDEQGKAGKLCSIGFCCNLMTRYSLSKKADKMAKDGIGLLVKGTFQKVSYRHIPAIRRMKSVYTRGYEDFDSRMPVFEELMEALADEDVNSIGVYGMGGVGKTTLVKRVAAQAIEDKLFDVVVMVEVTQTPAIKSLQEQIADELDLKFDEEGLPGRAAQLHERLKNETSVLLILDDIWEKLDLDAVGIRFWNDEKSGVTQEVDQGGRNANQRKWKLLLTSRDLDVLRNDMNTQKNFFVDTLSYEEAKNLFWKIVNHSKEKVDFDPIAIEIVSKCAGLPLAIRTMADVLNNKDISYWKNALQMLRTDPSCSRGMETSVYSTIEWKNALQMLRTDPSCSRGMETSVYSSIELSFQALGPEEQSFFLLCGLTDSGFGSDTNVLFKHCMGLNLFNNVDTLEDARCRMHKLIRKLKDSCLLLDGNAEGRVEMHDIVRDVAVSIASSNDKLMFNIRNVTSIKGMLEEKQPEDSIVVCHGGRNIKELPETLEFPNLKFPQMSQIALLYLQIPDGLFNNATELKVLDLTKFDLLSLPSSLCRLTNLQTLCLDQCLIGDIAIIGELKKLEILSFLGSEIEQLPREIGQLTCLRLLDLSNCSKLEVITPKVLSSLTRLEELYMGNSFVQWDVDEQHNASLVELKKLSNLTTLEIQVLDAQIIPPGLFFRKLEKYKIFIGDLWKWSDKCETLRMLKLKLNKSFFVSDEIKFLLNSVENLHLDEPKGAKNVLQELNGEGFQQLKHLHIQNAPQIQYISNSVGWGLCNVFPHRLESLVLHNLINLENIYHGQLTAVSLSQLKVIKVGKCDKLKHLTLPMLGNLLQLQEIEVTHCNKLEEIVFVESRQVHTSEQINKIVFTQLHTITLRCLSRLTRFGFNVLTSNMGFQEIIVEDDLNSFIPFFSQNALLPRLKNLTLFSVKIEHACLNQLPSTSFYFQTLVKLSVEEFSDLKFLFPYSMIRGFVQLRELVVQNCKSMEAIINTEEIAGEERLVEMIFPKLILLWLIGLPKLTRFGSGKLVKFPSLRSFAFKDCPKLKTFFSSSTSESIMVKRKLEKMNFCNDIYHLLDEQVLMPSLNELSLDSLNLEVIWNNQFLATSSYLHNLTVLVIHNLCNLKFLFPPSMVKSLVRLEVLEIFNCQLLEVVVVTEEERPSVVLFPGLLKLNLLDLPKLTRFCDFTEILDMSSLLQLWIKDCPNMETFISNFACAKWTASMDYSGMKTKENLQANVIQPFFDEKVQLSGLKGLIIEQMDNLRKVWHNQLYSHSFCKLESLYLDGCNKLFNVFPSNMLRRLQSLEKLVVLKCDSVEEIYELEAFGGKKTHGIVAAQLKTLRLHNLPKLKHVWNMDSQVILSSQNLHSISIGYCDSLKSLFPAIIARGLEQLENLYVGNCVIEEIIAKEDEVEVVPEFVFHQLTELVLFDLPGLKSFYSELYISKWPMLERLSVIRCNEVEMLALELQCYRESQHEIPSGQPLCLVDKIAFPSLNRLELNWNCLVNEMSYGKFSEYSCKLYSLGLSGPFMESAFCPTCFLCKLPKVTSLAIYNGFLKELFLCERLVCKVKHSELPSKLSLLELHTLSDSLLWEAYSEFDDVSQNLTTLRVARCHNIRSLVPFTMSFKNLTTLEVSDCDELLNLVASSMAKSLVQLTRMEITECKIIEEIISHKEDEVEDSIVFTQLKYLGLNHLPSLTIFYSGSCTIEFPSLQEVVVRQCPNMKIFSRGDLSTPSLHTLQIGETEGCWQGDLNTSIAQQHIEKDAQSSVLADEQIQRLEALNSEAQRSATFRHQDKMTYATSGDLKEQNETAAGAITKAQLDADHVSASTTETLAEDEMVVPLKTDPLPIDERGTQHTSETEGELTVQVAGTVKTISDENKRKLPIHESEAGPSDTAAAEPVTVFPPREKDEIPAATDSVIPFDSKGDEGLLGSGLDVKSSIKRTVLKIIGCMSDVKAGKIGVHGIGGIGKTSVLKALISCSKIKDIFDLIILVSVSRHWSVKKIQNEVIKQLSLSHEDSETDSEVAKKLFEVLSGKKFLLLLDDVWECIDFKALGIPDPVSENGCKIVVASRKLNVCHDMDVTRVIEVETMPREEACKLFSEQVGSVSDSPDIQPFVHAIVKGCGGLPLLTIVTGRALTEENNVTVWEHASKKFQLTGTATTYDTEDVIQLLKFSFDRLTDYDMQSCFLYCCLFPEDKEIRIVEFIEHCIQDGLIDGRWDRAHKRGLDIVDVLVRAFLVEVTEGGDTIKMHDSIRDLALGILSSGRQCLLRAYARSREPLNPGSSLSLECPRNSRLLIPEGPQCILRAGAGLKEPPLEEEWKQAKMIILMDNNLCTLPERPNCPELLTLFLQRNCQLRVIPPSFFDLMTSLKVLNLSKTRVKSLPKALFQLKDLQVLILRDCERLVMLPPAVGCLECLEVLDLQGTEINKLPNEIGKLALLRHLKVSFYGSIDHSEYFKLPHELISGGILSSLHALETLSIAVHPGDQRWYEDVKSVITDISNLTELTSLCFQFPQVEHLELFLETSTAWNAQHLTEFKFVVGHQVKSITARIPNYVEFDYSQQGQCLRFVNGERIPDAVLKILARSSAFFLDHHLDICSLSDFGVSNINGLKLCIISECPRIEKVVDSRNLTTTVLPCVERLSIHHLWNLTCIWEGIVPEGSFAALKLLSVCACPKLKYVFSSSMIQFVPNLEELDVEDCPALEEIVLESEIIDSDGILLPNLKKLTLHYLPGLVNIWKSAWPSLEHVSFYNCPRLKNIGIDSGSIREIKAEKSWWDKLEWEDTAVQLHLQKSLSLIHEDD